MSLYTPEFQALNEAEVRYVVVGRLATVLHGYARFTADINLIIDVETEAIAKTLEVLNLLGMRSRLLVDERDFSDPVIRQQWIQQKNMQVFSLWHPDNQTLSIDLCVDHPIEFDALWSRSQIVNLGSVQVRIASIKDLIQLKKIADRPQDRIDIEKLKEIQTLRKMRVMPESKRISEETVWQASWRDHETAQLASWLRTTPAQRLAWLEEAIALAHKAGALNRSTRD